jgi:hypothetical protein
MGSAGSATGVASKAQRYEADASDVARIRCSRRAVSCLHLQQSSVSEHFVKRSMRGEVAAHAVDAHSGRR